MNPIGNVAPDNPFLLAPLAGITDAPFRRICKKQGAAVVYTEMVSGKGIWYKDKKTEVLLATYEDEKPVAIQIFGNDPEIFSHVAERLDKRDNAILDINMGCPVPKIVKNGEGAALMKDPNLAGKLVEAVVAKTSKPVTVKMRIGWDKDHVNVVEMAKTVEAAGASAVAVHGRTREQYYTGVADWGQIGMVKASVRIPVIGNGDVFSAEDAIQMMRDTGCDYVMIARGALGNPWIFRDAMALYNGDDPKPVPTQQDNIDMLIKHMDMLEEEKGAHVAVMQIRKHVGWYLKGFPGIKTIKNKVHRTSDIDELRSLLLSLNPIQ